MMIGGRPRTFCSVGKLLAIWKAGLVVFSPKGEACYQNIDFLVASLKSNCRCQRAHSIPIALPDKYRISKYESQEHDSFDTRDSVFVSPSLYLS